MIKIIHINFLTLCVYPSPCQGQLNMKDTSTRSNLTFPTVNCQGSLIQYYTLPLKISSLLAFIGSPQEPMTCKFKLLSTIYLIYLFICLQHLFRRLYNKFLILYFFQIVKILELTENKIVKSFFCIVFMLLEKLSFDLFLQ